MPEPEPPDAAFYQPVTYDWTPEGARVLAALKAWSEATDPYSAPTLSHEEQARLERLKAKVLRMRAEDPTPWTEYTGPGQ